MKVTHAILGADDLIGASFPAAQPGYRHDDGRLLVLLGDEQTWLRASETELQAIAERFATLRALAANVELERNQRADETVARAFGPEPRVGAQP